jgi:hypothetical protein
MLYAIIIALFVLLIVVAVKWALVAREVRQLKANMTTMVTVEVAIAAADRRYESGIMEGERRSLRAAEDAVAARAAAAARAQFRNATK